MELAEKPSGCRPYAPVALPASLAQEPSRLSSMPSRAALASVTVLCAALLASAGASATSLLDAPLTAAGILADRCLLRPPSLRSVGAAPDEPLLKELGDQMAAAAGLESQPMYDHYETDGRDGGLELLGDGWARVHAGAGRRHRRRRARLPSRLPGGRGIYHGTDGLAGMREAFFLAPEGPMTAATIRIA